MVFSDAALNNLPDDIGSLQAFIIFLECNSKVVPIAWSSKKVARVCKNILYAECMVLSVSVDHALILRETLIETMCNDENEGITIPINTFTDCYSLFQNIHSETQADDLKTKREVASLICLQLRNSHSLIDYKKQADSGRFFVGYYIVFYNQ